MCEALWENSEKIEANKIYIRTLIAELNRVLERYDSANILIRKKQNYGVDRTKFECDFYQYLNNDIEAINLYMGEYMNQYSWAEITHGFLENKLTWI